MYGLVILTALSSGADPAPVSQPAPVVMNCTGCCGVVVSGCTGCYGSCQGVRYKHGLFGHHHASCMGCSGYSCNGWNCFGSCTGCMGSCWGCMGSCYGCMGSCYGCSGVSTYPSTSFGYGNIGFGYYSDPYAVYGTINRLSIAPAQGNVKPMDKPKEPMQGEIKKKDGTSANVKFRLPAEAKLYVDGRLTPLSGAERNFATPPLVPGQKYFYDVKAKIILDGKPMIEERRVLVEAGADVTSSFTALIAAAQRKTTPVAGK